MIRNHPAPRTAHGHPTTHHPHDVLTITRVLVLALTARTRTHSYGQSAHATHGHIHTTLSTRIIWSREDTLPPGARISMHVMLCVVDL